jgi:hypothetical protein
LFFILFSPLSLCFFSVLCFSPLPPPFFFFISSPSPPLYLYRAGEKSHLTLLNHVKWVRWLGG